jgi:hypothetical protein
MIDRIVELLGDEARTLLEHRCECIPRTKVHVTDDAHSELCFRPDAVERRVSFSAEGDRGGIRGSLSQSEIWGHSDRRTLQWLVFLRVMAGLT